MPSRDQIVEILKTVEDPEIFLDIWFLGLVYGIEITPPSEGQTKSKVKITMTFTTPMCPAGPQLVGAVKARVGALEDVEAVDVTITFDPPWHPSDEVKGMLGMM